MKHNTRKVIYLAFLYFFIMFTLGSVFLFLFNDSSFENENIFTGRI